MTFGGDSAGERKRNRGADKVLMRICLVAHNAFGALTGRDGHLGGVELQTAMLAEYLAGCGWDVSCITWRESSEPVMCANNVRILQLCAKDDGVPGIRFFHPRWTSLVKAMRQADADLYYQNGAEYVTGQVGLFCRLTDRKFVFSAASDSDSDRTLPALPRLREKWLYRYGLRVADSVIVQTEYQKQAMWSGFGVLSDVLPMPCKIPALERHTEESDEARIIWVGRIIRSKRLEMLLEIAERENDLRFDIVGGADGEIEYAEMLRDRAMRLPNVNWHGRVDHRDVLALYGRARLLLCTSELEGFPNTFLEAWGNGLPVVSTFDPDGIIGRKQLGVSASNLTDLVDGIRGLIDDYERWQAASRRCRQYFAERHDSEPALQRFERRFRLLCRDK